MINNCKWTGTFLKAMKMKVNRITKTLDFKYLFEPLPSKKGFFP